MAPEPLAAEHGRRGRQFFLAVLKATLFCTVAYFIFRFLADNFSDIQESMGSIRPWWLLLSAVLITCYLYCQALIWRRILIDLGTIIPVAQAVRLFFLSLFGKYIPGKIWIVAMRVGLSSFSGAPKGRLMASILIEHFFILSTAICLYLLTTENIFLIITGLALLVVIAITPNLCFKTMDMIAQLMGKDHMAVRLDLTSSVKYTMAYLATWTLLSTALWAAAKSLVPLDPYVALQIGGMYALSFVAGFLAPFAPGGLGVREGTFLLLSGQTLTTPIAGILAILMRLVFTVAELSGLGTSLILRRVKGEDVATG